MLILSHEILVFTYPEESLLQEDNFMFLTQNKDALDHFNQGICFSSVWRKFQSKDKRERQETFVFPCLFFNGSIACWGVMEPGEVKAVTTLIHIGNRLVMIY